MLCLPAIRPEGIRFIKDVVLLSVFLDRTVDKSMEVSFSSSAYKSLSLTDSESSTAPSEPLAPSFRVSWVSVWTFLAIYHRFLREYDFCKSY